MPLKLLNLLMYALVFVVVAVVFAVVIKPAYILDHLVLVERKGAGIRVGILVVIVEFTALAGGRTLRRILRKI